MKIYTQEINVSSHTLIFCRCLTFLHPPNPRYTTKMSPESRLHLCRLLSYDVPTHA